MSLVSKDRYLDYFFEFSTTRAKLALFRVVFFSLIALDGIRRLPRAARYGASDFNVGQLAWLEAILPAPERSAILLIFLLQAYLGLRIAMGVAMRSSLWLLTALYGYAYFVSQLDSFQHHYLIFLLLLLACFVPWYRDPDDSARTRSWAVRLILVQIGIVYAYAALAKCESVWLDGTVLGQQLPTGWTRDMAEWLGMGSAATAVMLTEAFLAFAFLSGRLLLVALPVGLGLHAGIQWGAKLDIELFSYFMFALYILLIPDSWFEWMGRHIGRSMGTFRTAVVRAVARRPVVVIATPISLTAGWLLADSLPLAESTLFAALVSALAILAVALAWLPRGIGAGPRQGADRRVVATAALLVHLGSLAAIAWWPETEEKVGDYYKLWAGNARRLGNWDEAGQAYKGLLKLRPKWSSAHYYLGVKAQREERIDDALGHYERAQRANHNDHRGFFQAAQIHHAAKRGQEARAAAERVVDILQRKRNSRAEQQQLQRARGIVEYWSRK